ncbi:MAG: YeeE/YedE family protein [Rhodospirillum sp.]|nr:YeeE/YedE family protein [Rhodospirillum sp.]MCF8489426.1 YeeE/YedE family protein [Rhodospirillum sp.]MCF8502785.1 YeeE/YedE family protein [Rhodospirillum sp.]
MEAWFMSDVLGDLEKAGVGGLVVGLIFGFCAQRSQFCLRAATIEFWRGSIGPKVAIWLTVFGVTLLLTQIEVTTGILSLRDVRQVTSAGTLSGALVGGLLFGIGMILSRGCASRLLVLSGTGNMRALVTGLVVTVVAQASLTGVLSPLREGLSRLWIIGPEARNLSALLPQGTGLLLGAMTVGLALVVLWRSPLARPLALAAAGVGGAIALAWAYTQALSSTAFEPVPVVGVTFTGPSADTLMALITQPSVAPEFGIGLVPGVFLGSLLSAVTSGSFRFQAFDASTGMTRYMVGAALMGFGGMLAGGCAVGAGVTGGSVLSLTAWAALAAMWAGAGVTDALVDKPRTLGAAVPSVGTR